VFYNQEMIPELQYFHADMFHQSVYACAYMHVCDYSFLFFSSQVVEILFQLLIRHKINDKVSNSLICYISSCRHCTYQIVMTQRAMATWLKVEMQSYLLRMLKPTLGLLIE